MKYFVRFILTVALILEGFSFLMKLFMGSVASYGFNFFSAFISIFILLFSFVTLSVLALKTQRKEIWFELKQEILMFIATIVLMSLVGVIN